MLAMDSDLEKAVKVEHTWQPEPMLLILKKVLM